jgi:hypothetical protein
MSFTSNPYKNRCQLAVGSTFIFRGYYCIVTKMSYNYFTYTIQETNGNGYMHYDFYLKTPSAAGRKLNYGMKKKTIKQTTKSDATITKNVPPQAKHIGQLMFDIAAMQKKFEYLQQKKNEI